MIGVQIDAVVQGFELWPLSEELDSAVKHEAVNSLNFALLIKLLVADPFVGVVWPLVIYAGPDAPAFETAEPLHLAGGNAGPGRKSEAKDGSDELLIA